MDPLKELPKDPGNNDIPSNLDYLTTMIATLLSVVMQVRDSINYGQGEIDDLKTEVSDLKNTCDESKSEVLKLQCEMRTLKQSHSKMEDRVIRMESQSRRNNLLIDGIAEIENESAKDCLDSVYNILQNKLQIANAKNIKIVRCHKLPTHKPPNTLVKLHWFGDRELIWDKRSKLKNSNMWINEDFPVEITQHRRKLQLIMREARRQGKQANISVDKLIIEGRSYTVDSLDRLPEELSPARVATRTNGEITALFFTAASPLSNFSPKDIKDNNGLIWHSNEQKHQHDKCVKFKDNESCQNSSRVLWTWSKGEKL